MRAELLDMLVSPRMPDEPLIFVEVALGVGIASSVQDLLDLDAPQSVAADIDSAVFYSISNAQAGLRDIGFGDFLIKRVVEDLRNEMPRVKHFATLSPIPGLRRWFESTSDADVAKYSSLPIDAPQQFGPGWPTWVVTSRG